MRKLVQNQAPLLHSIHKLNWTSADKLIFLQNAKIRNELNVTFQQRKANDIRKNRFYTKVHYFRSANTVRFHIFHIYTCSNTCRSVCLLRWVIKLFKVTFGRKFLFPPIASSAFLLLFHGLISKILFYFKILIAFRFYSALLHCFQKSKRQCWGEFLQ